MESALLTGSVGGVRNNCEFGDSLIWSGLNYFDDANENNSHLNYDRVFIGVVITAWISTSGR
jgi:hypothetical protein